MDVFDECMESDDLYVVDEIDSVSANDKMKVDVECGKVQLEENAYEVQLQANTNENAKVRTEQK